MAIQVLPAIPTSGRTVIVSAPGVSVDDVLSHGFADVEIVVTDDPGTYVVPSGVTRVIIVADRVEVAAPNPDSVDRYVVAGPNSEPAHDALAYRRVGFSLAYSIDSNDQTSDQTNLDALKESLAALAHERGTVDALTATNEQLTRENRELAREVDRTVAERADAADVARRYNALRHSKLGRATLKYWDVRRKIRRD